MNDQKYRDEETALLVEKCRKAWNALSSATDNDQRWEAKHHFHDCAADLAWWMMGDIRGNSPDECENPDTVEIAPSPTVRAIVLQIYAAAQQSRRSGSAFEKTLLYIAEKEKEASKMKGPNSLKNTLYYVKATCASTSTPAHKIARIEQITAQVLNIPFQAVQS